MNGLLDMIWRYLSPGIPSGLTVPCPDAPAGAATIDAVGAFDPGTLNSAYLWTNVASLAVITLAVLACYTLKPTTLGPRFVRRWWAFAGTSAALCAATSLILRFSATQALAQSCENNPEPFPSHLPWAAVGLRAIVGAIWGIPAFLVIAGVLTQTVGRVRRDGGFFHNRGYPFPRLFKPAPE